MDPKVTVALIMVFMMLLLMGSGIWIGIAMGLVGIVTLYFFFGSGSLLSVGYISYNCLHSFTLSALPLFIFMATMLGASGLSDRFYRSAAAIFARLPGGLLHANIVGCALFAAVCGSTAACAAAMGTVAAPALKRRNYPMGIATASLVAAGTLGLMIPPSLSMITFGMLTGTSVGQLFMAGILPGILIAILFMIYIYFYAIITKKVPQEEPMGFINTSKEVLSIWPLALLILAVLGTIYAGICTPTEASGIGAFGSIVATLLMKRFSRKVMWQALEDGLRLSVMIALIIVGAFIMSATLANLGIPQRLAAFVTSIELSTIGFIAFLSVFYLLLGCVMDGLAMVVMTIPILFPISLAVGLNPVFFGILVVIYGEMAAITPPVGLNLFVMQGVTGEPLHKVARGVLPFVALLLVTIVILVIWPDLALIIPKSMTG